MNEVSGEKAQRWVNAGARRLGGVPPSPVASAGTHELAGKPQRKLAVVAAMSTVALTAAGCTTLPSESTPEVVSSFAAAPKLEEAIQPIPGRPSDLMLRDFFSASAHPGENHAAARRFLTPGATRAWSTHEDMFIIDKMDVASEGSASSDRISYKVRGNLIGSLGVGGVFTPMFTGYETTYDLVRVDGEWRVDNLPDAVIVDRADFSGVYQPRDIYFVDSHGAALVPDRRWVYVHQQSLSASLISLLVAGPQPNLSRGVRTMLPSGSTAQTRTPSNVGVDVDFSGLTNLNQNERELLAAQVIWTLAASDIRGPYSITADGAALNETIGESWQVSNVSKFDPRAEAVIPLRAVVGGRVTKLGAGDPSSVTGWLNEQYNESVAVNPQGSVFAVVSGRGEERRTLRVGPEDGQPLNLLEAKSLTRPTWAAHSEALYTVIDGEKLVRFERRDLGAMDRMDVDMSDVDVLKDPNARISVFRMSPDGVHAVMIINGRSYVSVLENANDGRQKLSRPIQVGHQLGDTAISADWRPNNSLVVGTRASDSPMWEVAIDGSTSTQLSARNLSAPVVAVAANSQVIYATDARALMQLESGDMENQFWREVPALQGQRAAPILAY